MLALMDAKLLRLTSLISRTCMHVLHRVRATTGSSRDEEKTSRMVQLG
jgi:hypothetical protein